MERVGGFLLGVELAGFVFLDQMPADVVLILKGVERGADEVLLDDLALDGGAVASVSAHGLSYSERPT